MKFVTLERGLAKINFTIIFEENDHINSIDKIAGDVLSFATSNCCTVTDIT